MNRSARRSSFRRPRHANSVSPPPSSGDMTFGRHSPVSPTLRSHSWHQSSQTGASQSAAHHGRRPSRSSLNYDAVASTPEPSRDPAWRKKPAATRASDAYAESAATPAGPDGDDGPTKGGHSLRRRARVNYATEQIEDEVIVPSSSSASRQRRRRPDGTHEDSSEDLHGTGLRPKRRGASFGPDTTPTSARRRNPSRKSAESRAYFEDFDDDARPRPLQDQADEIHDTILVGNYSSNTSSPSSKSDSRESVSNNLDSPGAKSDGQRRPNLINQPPETLSSESAGADHVNSGSAADQARDPAQENVADPSQQLQVESIESRQFDGCDSDHSPRAPISCPSPSRRSKTPPMTSGHGAELTNAADSPKATENGMPQPEASGDADPAPDRPSTPAAGERQISLGVDTGKDKAEAPPEKKDPAKSSPRTPARDLSNGEPSQEEKIMKSSPIRNHPGEVDGSTPVRAAAAPSTPLETEAPAEQATETLAAGDEPAPGSPLKEEVAAEKPAPVLDPRWCQPQPVPEGRWSHLTPYVDGQYSVYPEKKARAEDEYGSEDQSPEDKDSKEPNDADTAADDAEDIPDAAATELPTPALNTPTRGSPVPDDVAALNSPAPAGEEPEDVDSPEPQDSANKTTHYRYRKLRDPEEFISAIENYEDMSTAELYDALQAINLSLNGWQEEWSHLGKVVDDYENASRRRIADAKYETRTRNLHQHGINYEEPEFGVRGYKAKERETISETRYLQSQDRIMAAVYGFEYDPHPSKIGRQNPETQQAGVTTRGRSLRNQPRQTAKATEAENVTGKRTRKPVQLFDPATQEGSRASSPVSGLGRGRRRRNAQNDNEDAQPSLNSSFNDNSDVETASQAPGPARRRRGGRARGGMPRAADDDGATNGHAVAAQEETPRSSGRRARQKAAHRDDEAWTAPHTEGGGHKHQRRMLTLKIPRGNFSEPSSGITDNGDSRPSTASSESTTHTIESSYSFRPKRQKRFRDEPEDVDGAVQPPPRKRGRRAGPSADGDELMMAVEPLTPEVPQSNGSSRKTPKIKVMRPSDGPAPDSRNGTPMSLPTTEGGDEQPKEYRTMTKSEKMSASMKNRWANGNMAGAVEKRKATLAAKKAAQAAAEQRFGPIAPKPKVKTGKKEAQPLPVEAAPFIRTHPPPHPQMHPQAQLPPQPAPQPHHPHHHHHAHHARHPHHEYAGMGAPFRTS